jgi:ferric-dicitrate binding protein FerR (iron transport regulator)
VPADYGETRRELTLVGRAHFRVAHDAARVFHVHAHGVIAEARGTQFSVASDERSTSVEIVVNEGRVSVANERDSLHGVLLQAGDRLVQREGAALITRGVPAAQLVAWTTGARLIDRGTVRDVIPLLARWYGLDVRVADDRVLDRRLSAEWTTATAATVLAEMAQLLQVSVVQRGEVITLVPVIAGSVRE